MTTEEGQDGVQVVNLSRAIPTVDLKCEICSLLWIVASETLNSALQVHRDKRYCKNCFEYIKIQTHPCEILSDPYDVRNWTGLKLPIHLFHCCGCVSIYKDHSLNNSYNGLIELQVFKPYSTHVYCIDCFLFRVHNSEKGMSPFGCCMK